MIEGHIERKIRKSLEATPVVALLGPRQVGKTTLAKQILEKIEKEASYLDLDNEIDLSKLAQKQLFLRGFKNKLLIIDEIQNKPDLFPVMRSLIDIHREAGEQGGHFFILGSATRDLLQQSSETLAGRIRYFQLGGFSISETMGKMSEFDINRLWYRGGFPRSYLALDEDESWQWRQDFISTYVERDIPQLGQRLPSIRLRNFWSMLGHAHGTQSNQGKLATALSVSNPTIKHYLDILTDLYMVRQLQPWSGNSKKRLVKSPKVYIRDSGLLHNLVHVSDPEMLMGHPVVGHSWECFIIENIITSMSNKWRWSYYKTQAGAEIDLILESPKDEIWAVEVKRTLQPKTKGFVLGCQNTKATKKFFVHAGDDRYPISEDVEAIGIVEFLELLEA